MIFISIDLLRDEFISNEIKFDSIELKAMPMKSTNRIFSDNLLKRVPILSIFFMLCAHWAMKQIHRFIVNASIKTHSNEN